nr:hypothetical protein [Tanacetum cinerariifolium]
MVVSADLSEMELKKILIEKMEGNKSIQRSDEQMNLYKALVEAYESDKIILDTYGETVTLKRRRDDDADKDKEPSAGPDRGLKRRRKGKEHESASALMKTTTGAMAGQHKGLNLDRRRQASLLLQRSLCRLPLRWKSPHIWSLTQKNIKEQVKEQVKDSYAVAADLSEMELKKILIEKMEGNKSIQRSDEQMNLYKALVEAYESDKIILDTYGETVTLKRRR